MASTDDRVVKMEFDNKAFEKNVNDTITSLGKLQNALKMEGIKKALTDLHDTAKNINIAEGVSQGIEGVSKKFLAMGAIGVSVIDNLVNKVLTAGPQLAKSLSLDNVISGFQEYETNIGSIQTILANTAKYGTGLDDVTKSLDELNTYSDKTIYSFGDMVKNIGLFTNAGLKVEDATSIIKGFSNSAAASGVNAEAAAGAAYQLSQALNAGTVRLMDFRSLQNVGLGNKVMQEGLVELAQSMGTLDAAGTNSKEVLGDFNHSLEKGWLSADVMSYYLKIMSGDMSEADQAALGLSKSQIDAFAKTQGIAEDAATKIRTFTQLMNTVKEAIGSGWSATFRVLIGNFNEATDLFTNINNAISGFVGKNAQARLDVLNQWKLYGGRTFLIKDLGEVFKKLGVVVSQISKAFRDVFPRKTGGDLVKMTVGFTQFLKALIPSAEGAKKIGLILRGLFSIIKIGWNIIKGVVKLFFTLADAVGNLLGGSGFPDLLVTIANFFYELQKGQLSGKAIADFFTQLGVMALKPIAALGSLITKVKDFFAALDFSKDKPGDKTKKEVSKVSDGLSILDKIFARFAQIGRGLKTAFNTVVHVCGVILGYITGFFKSLGGAISKALGDGNFDHVFDILNTGLLAGIATLLYKFFKDPLKNVGQGFFKKINGIFTELQKTLKTFQAKIKADALFRIAEAIALLTASVLVLSLIDSAALTKALAAMTVGFGELLGVFAAIQKIGEKTKQSAGQFALVAAGLILLAGAMFILALAAAILSRLDWNEIAKGMTSVAGLMATLVGAIKLMGDDSEDAIKAGVGMIAVGGALLILALALKIFGAMDPKSIAQGMITIAGGLVVITKAMKSIDSDNSIKDKSRGILEIGIALNLLAFAVKKFAGLSWSEMAKGLAGIAGGLKIIGVVLNGINNAKALETGAAILLISVAMTVMSKAIQMMGSMDLATLGKGIGGIAAVLIALETALSGIEGDLAAAGTIAVMAGALILMAVAVKTFAGIKFGELLKGVASIAIVIGTLAVIGVLAEAAAEPLGVLAIALLAIGAGLFLFGAAAFLAGKAFESFSKSGAAGAKNVVKAMETIGKALPALFEGFAEGTIEFVKTIAEFAPQLTESIVKILSNLLDGVKTIVPKIGEVISLIIDTILMLIVQKLPEIEDAGIQLILALIRGIGENVQPILDAAFDVLNQFVDGMGQHVPETITKITDMFIGIMNSIAYNLGRIAATLMGGLALQFIKGFIDGVGQNMHLIKEIWSGFPSKIIGWIGDVTRSLRQKGLDLIIGLFNGIKERFSGSVNSVMTFFKTIGGYFTSWFGNALDFLHDTGKNIIQGLWNGIKEVWHDLTNWVSDAASHLPGFLKGPLHISSPSKVTMEIGKNIVQGLIVGMEKTSGINEAASNMGDTAKKNLMAAFSNLAVDVGSMDEFNPVITPVLDLSAVRTDASRIADYIAASSINVPSNVALTAQNIAATTVATTSPADATVSGSGDVIFQQTINAPEQLSTADIYRQSRNMITSAKEELKIPS